MPYIVLAIGLLIGAFALYRFFTQASVTDIKTGVKWFVFALFTLVLLFFAMTGRIVISLALLLIAGIFFIAQHKKQAVDNEEKKKLPPPKDDDE